MTNVTMSLDEEVAQWARIEAARRNTSVSRLLGQMLREKMEQAQRYELAKQAYLEETRDIAFKSGSRYLTREQANDRRSLR
jgi:hypothetical protein